MSGVMVDRVRGVRFVVYALLLWAAACVHGTPFEPETFEPYWCVIYTDSATVAVLLDAKDKHLCPPAVVSLVPSQTDTRHVAQTFTEARS